MCPVRAVYYTEYNIYIGLNWHPDDSYIQPTVDQQLIITTFKEAQIANNRVNGLSVIWKHSSVGGFWRPL